MYNVISRLEVGQEAWDAFVDASDEAWLWHRFDFSDTISTWPDRCDISFAVFDDGTPEKIVAVVPLQLIKSRTAKFLNRTMLDTIAGPARKNGLGKKQKQKVLDYIHEQLIVLSRHHGAVEINLSLPPMVPACQGDRCPRVNPLLVLGCENSLTQTWVIDLRRSEMDIRNTYSQLTKRELRKIRAHNLEIREAHSKRDLEIYYKLHCETYHRTGVEPHPFKYFQYIFDKFVSVGLSRIVFLVLDGSVVAAQNTGLYKGGCIYWTGASKSTKRGGENRILFDEQIIFAKKKGYEWYEIGEAFPHLKEGKLKGLNDFKRSFGGELYPFYRGQIVRSSYKNLLYTFGSEFRRLLRHRTRRIKWRY